MNAIPRRGTIVTALGTPRRAAALVRRRVAGAALRSEGFTWPPDRRTVALAALAAATTIAVVAGEVGRVWRRGRTPLPSETDELLPAAQSAFGETVEVAVAGYKQVSSRENATFNLLTSFVATFVGVRTVTWFLRSRDRFGPFRNIVVRRRHIHHYVPGIILAFSAGGIAIVTRDEDIEPKLALVFGAGLGLTLDESALLLELEDVYWTREGVLGVQITLAVTALIGALALGVRFMRRGEELVLEEDRRGGGPGRRHGDRPSGPGAGPAPPPGAGPAPRPS